jgi:hypothetical protein
MKLNIQATAEQLHLAYDAANSAWSDWEEAKAEYARVVAEQEKRLDDFWGAYTASCSARAEAAKAVYNSTMGFLATSPTKEQVADIVRETLPKKGAFHKNLMATLLAAVFQSMLEKSRNGGRCAEDYANHLAAVWVGEMLIIAGFTQGESNEAVYWVKRNLVPPYLRGQ